MSRYTADRALDTLAAEGLVQRIAGVGTIVVAAASQPEAIDAPPGAVIRARMPTAAERAEYSLPPGTPVLCMDIPGTAAPQIYGADRAYIRVPAPRRRLTHS